MKQQQQQQNNERINNIRFTYASFGGWLHANNEEQRNIRHLSLACTVGSIVWGCDHKIHGRCPELPRRS